MVFLGVSPFAASLRMRCVLFSLPFFVKSPLCFRFFCGGSILRVLVVYHGGNIHDNVECLSGCDSSFGSSCLPTRDYLGDHKSLTLLWK